jgi:hypothetical protein
MKTLSVEVPNLGKVGTTGLTFCSVAKATCAAYDAVVALNPNSVRTRRAYGRFAMEVGVPSPPPPHTHQDVVGVHPLCFACPGWIRVCLCALWRAPSLWRVGRDYGGLCCKHFACAVEPLSCHSATTRAAAFPPPRHRSTIGEAACVCAVASQVMVYPRKGKALFEEADNMEVMQESNEQKAVAQMEVFGEVGCRR